MHKQEVACNSLIVWCTAYDSCSIVPDQSITVEKFPADISVQILWLLQAFTKFGVLLFVLKTHQAYHTPGNIIVLCVITYTD